MCTALRCKNVVVFITFIYLSFSSFCIVGQKPCDTYTRHVDRVRELTRDRFFQDVAFLPSRSGFSTTFLKNCRRG